MTETYLNTQSSLSMKGSGYYSAKTAGAKNEIDKTQKVIENALKNIPSNGILKFADFGSANGGTSQEMLSNIIKIIRDRGDNRQIEILYTDLASNDLQQFFHHSNQIFFEKLLHHQYLDQDNLYPMLQHS